MAYKECIFHVYSLNEHFSPEFADAQHEGKESENNRRYDWEDEFSITSNVNRIDISEDAIYPLQGFLPDGQVFKYEVPSMLIFSVFSDDAPMTYVGASQSMVERYDKVEDEGKVVFRIFLKDYEPMANPVPGVYIASKEFPKDLIF
jgi:hypothetical protein